MICFRYMSGAGNCNASYIRVIYSHITYVYSHITYVYSYRYNSPRLSAHCSVVRSYLGPPAVAPSPPTKFSGERDK
jgi:hypothetical protein